MFKTLKSKVFAKFIEWWHGRSLLNAVQAEIKINPNIKKIVDKDIKPLWFSAWEATLVVVLFIFFLLLTHAQTLFPYETFIGK